MSKKKKRDLPFHIEKAHQVLDELLKSKNPDKKKVYQALGTLKSLYATWNRKWGKDGRV